MKGYVWLLTMVAFCGGGCDGEQDEVASSKPVLPRISGQAALSFSEANPDLKLRASYTILWEFPARPHSVWRHAFQDTGRGIWYLGPCVVEVTDDRGVRYTLRDHSARIMLPIAPAPHTLAVCVPSVWPEHPAPTATDGRVFDAERDIPTAIAVTVAGEYQFLWLRGDGDGPTFGFEPE